MMDHVFVAACCLFCGADDHDVDLPDKCPDRTENDAVTYTTETGKQPTGINVATCYSCGDIYQGGFCIYCWSEEEYAK